MLGTLDFKPSYGLAYHPVLSASIATSSWRVRPPPRRGSARDRRSTLSLLSQQGVQHQKRLQFQAVQFLGSCARGSGDLGDRRLYVVSLHVLSLSPWTTDVRICLHGTGRTFRAQRVHQCRLEQNTRLSH